jgi:hypothetical protein
MRKVKYVKVNITVPDLTVAGTTITTPEFTLDTFYPKIPGVALWVKSLGGTIIPFDVKIEQSDGKVIHDLIDYQTFQSLSNERYKSLGDLDNYGQGFKVSTYIYENCTSELIYQLEFMLSNE